MQETGMVRRIDELGRVVIPKEMRRTLRIREGDPLEIYTDKEQLIFKKYSPVSTINTYAEAVADGIEELTEKVCIVTDNDAVVYVSKGKMKDTIGNKITKDLENILKERKSIAVSRIDGGTILPLIDGVDLESENQIVVPIISGGDCYGSLIVFDKDKSSRFSSNDVKFVRLGATFLSKQLD
jgi:AbrB family transcriptional regulator (stage V sporulation protein T)